MNTPKLEHPVLNIVINGSEIYKRPSSFTLVTDESLPSVIAKLSFPNETQKIKTEDSILVFLNDNLLFTGFVYSLAVNNNHLDVLLTDDYKKLCGTYMTLAYRKENASFILQDILDACKISNTIISCPSVQIDRFSTDYISADLCIALLIKTLQEHGYKNINYFFDEKNNFCFAGVKNENVSYEFTTAGNIIRRGEGFIEVLPLPIRHSQIVIADKKQCVVKRSDLIVSGSRSRLKLWLKAMLKGAQ